MKEKSVIALLDQQREKNQRAYKTLFGSLNLSGVPNGRDLSSSNLTGHRLLTNAGFEPESLVDRLTEGELRLLSSLARQDVTKFYLEDDLKRIAQRYGLRKVRTSEYQGMHRSYFVDDLETFQAQLQSTDKKEYSSFYTGKYRYHLIGTNSALCGYDTSARHTPLLFFSLDEGIYFLVSNRDLWVSSARRWLYQPLTTPLLSNVIFLFVAVLAMLLFHPVVLAFLYLLWFVYFTRGMLFSEWKTLDTVPHWLRKIVITLIPR